MKINIMRPLTEKTALLFEAALDISAEPLMTLQVRYNMLSAKKDVPFMKRLTEIRRIASMP